MFLILNLIRPRREPGCPQQLNCALYFCLFLSVFSINVLFVIYLRGWTICPSVLVSVIPVVLFFSPACAIAAALWCHLSGFWDVFDHVYTFHSNKHLSHYRSLSLLLFSPSPLTLSHCNFACSSSNSSSLILEKMLVFFLLSPSFLLPPIHALYGKNVPFHCLWPHCVFFSVIVGSCQTLTPFSNICTMSKSFSGLMSVSSFLTSNVI